jgi:hypothetical protein
VVLYYAANHAIRARAPTTGASLWQDTTISTIHWESPVVANGTLYITDESGALTAYALPHFAPAMPLAANGLTAAALLLVGVGAGSRSRRLRGTRPI